MIVIVKKAKLDAACAKEFRQAVETHWEPSIKYATIDLEAVDFVDSSGIGALLSVQKKLPEMGESVTLRNAHPNVLSVIELLRLHRVFNVQSKD